MTGKRVVIYLRVRGISILPFSTIFLLDFGTIPTLWYFCFFHFICLQWAQWLGLINKLLLFIIKSTKRTSSSSHRMQFVLADLTVKNTHSLPHYSWIQNKDTINTKFVNKILIEFYNIKLLQQYKYRNLSLMTKLCGWIMFNFCII